MFRHLNALILIGSMSLAVFSAPVGAAPMSEKEWESVCVSLADTSSSIMRARQSGIPMKKALEIGNGSPTFAAMMKSIVMEAYAKPRYQTENMQKRAIQDFEDEILSMCLKIQPKK